MADKFWDFTSERGDLSYAQALYLKRYRRGKKYPHGVAMEAIDRRIDRERELTNESKYGTLPPRKVVTRKQGD